MRVVRLTAVVGFLCLHLASCGGGDSGTAEPPSPAMVALTVSGAGAGGGTVSSAPAGLDCRLTAGAADGACVARHVTGTVVTLTATARSGSRFVDWSGACTGPSAQCAVVLDRAAQARATFELRSGPGVTVAAGGAQTGVAFAPEAMPLGVEVVGADGRPAAGVTVRFVAEAPPDRADLSRGVFVCPPGPSACGQESLFSPEPHFWSTNVVTDSVGRAAVRVRFGHIAGPTHVVATVPSLGVEVRVPYDVTPGPIARATIAPSDTAVFVGRTVQFRATFTDAWHNPHPVDAESWAIDGDGATVDGGGVARGSTVGRSRLTARRGAVSAAAQLSVVPPGRFTGVYRGGAADWLQPAVRRGVFVVNLDGSGYRHLASEARDYPQAALSPDGSVLIARDGRIVRAESPERDFIATRPVPFTNERHPMFTADGAFVHFTANTDGRVSVWRATRDGTAPTLVWRGTDEDYAEGVVRTLDGRTGVLWGGAQQNLSSAALLDLATGARSPFAAGFLDGVSMSADGTAWAIVEMWGIAVGRTGGVDARIVAPRDGYWVAMGATKYALSPDGAWLLLSADSGASGTLVLLRVSDGLRIPLPYTRNWYAPNGLEWR